MKFRDLSGLPVSCGKSTLVAEFACHFRSHNALSLLRCPLCHNDCRPKITVFLWVYPFSALSKDSPYNLTSRVCAPLKVKTICMSTNAALASGLIREALWRLKTAGRNVGRRWCYVRGDGGEKKKSCCVGGDGGTKVDLCWW